MRRNTAGEPLKTAALAAAELGKPEGGGLPQIGDRGEEVHSASFIEWHRPLPWFREAIGAPSPKPS
ncbi:hypothetical protein GGE07_005392 [Sinorhizobium terangae]|uniref:Uncharacterized protein n=1 Tax=Sinorhizobium terangae TaxID=110322 RepID=A0A6N7LM07_SINTE|nr:hypothetical protein [Sinorhizobium terangae]MBB4188713.1 hypothetical protein [Sinorhizobium terangae]MQX18872.1 hypothetical protein [Sinorhizobium terangae]